MKHSLRFATLSLLAVGSLCAHVALADGPPLALPEFETLARKASEAVTISLDTATLGVAASFLDPSDPQDVAAKELVKGLKGIYVRNFTFEDDDFSDSQFENELNSLRMQLKSPGWQSLFSIRNNREQTSSEIYVSIDQGRTSGLVIINSEPREFTVVHIIGEIDMEKLHRLEGRFGIPKLPDRDALAH
jgi:hypothetical protein